MSLINDALKRAQTAQRPILPVPRAEFRPVNDPPAPSPKYGLPVLLLVGVAVFPILGLLVVRMVLHGDSSDIQAKASPAPVAASVHSAPAATPPSPTPPAPTQPAPAQPAPEPPSAASVATPPAPTASQPPPAVGQTSTAVTAAPIPAAQAVGGTATITPPVESVKPTAPRLQSIVFHPTRPSAMINGRVAFIGDKLPEGKVVTISQDRVTLNAAGETIVLTLPE